MSRPKDFRKRVEVAPRPSSPLHNPFAALGELDALKSLPVVEEPKLTVPEPKADRPAKPPKPMIPRNSRGRLVLRRETKHRGGKAVVIVSGFTELPGANAVMIGDLAKDLKGKLGCGGTFDRQEIVLQGDRAAAVCALLEELGFRVDGVRS
jgi:translation initiation factor 1